MMKKTDKKHAGRVLTAALVLSCLTACGGGGKEQAPGESQVSTQRPAEEEPETDYFESQEAEEAETAAANAPEEEEAASGKRLMEVYCQDNRLDEWDGSDRLMEVGYDTLQINEQEYPELSWSVGNYNRESEAKAAAWKEESLPWVRESYSDGTFHGCEYGRNVRLKRADGIALSFVTEVTEYTGGAHGSTSFESSTFDTATGGRLALEDIVTDVSRLPGAVARALMEQSPEGLFSEEPTQQIETMFDPEWEYYHEPSWTLDYGGLTFYFGHYELGSYVFGCQEAFIAFGDYPDLFKEPYSEASEEYAVGMDPFTSQYADLNGDGKRDEISVYYYGNEFEDQEIHVSVNGDEVIHRAPGWFGDAFFIKLRDGRYYLYVGMDDVDEIHTIHVFGLTGGQAWYVGDYSGNLESSLSLNPGQFKVISGLNTLSTYMGYQSCHVGNDGLPDPDSSSYTVMQYEYDGKMGPYVTAKRPVPVRMVSADGSVAAKTEEMPAGTVFYFYKTDDQTYVEMKLEDGRSCRIEVDRSGGWPQTVNGMDINECFDGIAFAG